MGDLNDTASIPLEHIDFFQKSSLVNFDEVCREIYLTSMIPNKVLLILILFAINLFKLNKVDFKKYIY